MVEQRTLTPLVLVRVQVSQPLQKPLIFNGFFSLKFAFRPVLLYKRLVDTLKTENEMAFFKKKNKDLPALTKDNLMMYKRVWLTYVAPKWKLLALSIVLMLVASSFDALLVSQLKPVFDEVFLDKNRALLGRIGLIILGLYFLKGAFSYSQALVMTKLSIGVIRGMQFDVFKKLLAMDNKFYQKHTLGEILTRFGSDVATVQGAVLGSLTTFVRDSASVFFLVLLMFWQSFEMACVVFFVFPATIWPIVIFGKKMRQKFRKNREVDEKFFDQVTQTFKSIKIVKSYCTEDLEFENAKKTIYTQNKLQFSMAILNALQHPMTEFVGGVGMAATLAYGGYKITAGEMTAGNFMVFLLAIVAAYKPMKNLGTLHMTLQQGVVSMQRLFSMLDIVPDIRDKPGAEPLKITAGRIEMKNVSFSYDGEHPVVKNVTVTCEPNRTVAFVGHSGSGKSTMINFIPRFYDPDAGEVVIDGQNVRDVTLESLRKQTAYVSQDVILFKDTIKNNIRYGMPEATDEQIVAAAKAAAAHDFIMGTPDGYDTVLGEQGSGLSGGQRQMISIARAMLKNAPILLLDEATAALDSKSESVVQNSLERLMRNRTTIVIAHRLSTIINADRIYVFNEGEIVEQGTHAELVASDGVYAQMYRIQYRKSDAETANG